MSLLDYFTGGRKPNSGARTGQSLTFMDRFMNPATQAGISMLSGGSAAEGMASGNQYLQQKKADLLQQSIGASITNPEERALLMMAPEQYVSAKLSRTASRPVRVNDTTVYIPGEGFQSSGMEVGTNGWTPESMRKEFNYSEYTPESVAAAEAQGNPGLLVRDEKDPDLIATKAGTFERAAGTIEKRLEPIRQGMSSIQLANKLLTVGGGPADYGALVSFVKATDPGTAAREGEVSAASAAQGYLNVIGEIAQKAQAEGGFMTPEMKNSMARALKGMRDIYQDNYGYITGNYVKKYADSFQLDPDLLRGAPINFGLGEVNVPPGPKLLPALGDLAGDVAEKTGVNEAVSGAVDAAGKAIDGVINPAQPKTQLVKENGKWVRKRVQ